MRCHGRDRSVQAALLEHNTLRHCVFLSASLAAASAALLTARSGTVAAQRTQRGSRGGDGPRAARGAICLKLFMLTLHSLFAFAGVAVDLRTVASE